MSVWLDRPLGMLSIADLGIAVRPASPTPRARGLFLDIDGTLVERLADGAELADPAQLRLLPDVAASLARLAAAGLTLVIVTNQGGIGRGYYSRAQFARVQQALLAALREQAGVAIADVAVCPHSPDAQGRPACLCRKPAPGMLVRTARALGLDLARSWMVGDTLDDVEAGHRAGAQALLLDTGGETAWRRSPLREPDAVFTDWPRLAAHLEALLALEAAGQTLMSDAAASGGPMAAAGDGSPAPGSDPDPGSAPAPRPLSAGASTAQAPA